MKKTDPNNQRKSDIDGLKIRTKSKKLPASQKGRVKKKRKSATLRSVERTSKIEQSELLRAMTHELPHLPKRHLDRPIRQRKFNAKNFEFSFQSLKKPLIIAGASLVIFLAGLIFINIMTVDTVIVEGSTHYTNEEIYNMVVGDGFLGKSSIYLKFKYRNKAIKDVPFIETMKVSIIDRSSIKVTVYEKALAGYVEHLGKYFYFDKDGTVVESSDVNTKGIPLVYGLNFDYIVLYERLPVENENIFKEILDITQLLNKYEIDIDKIYFDGNYNVTLYFDEARVRLGNFDYIDEKIIKLKSILPQIYGKRGVLRLDNYNGVESATTFELDK